MAFTMQDAISEGWTNKSTAIGWFFEEGFQHGLKGKRFQEYENVRCQAYDRGYLCGTQEARRFNWADDPNIGKN